MHNSKCLIDRLNAALVEKSQECAEHIETMEDRIKETELLREEKDSLVVSSNKLAKTACLVIY